MKPIEDLKMEHEAVKITLRNITLLNQHIEKENNVLFVLADNNLSDEKQSELMEGFEKIETQKIGPGKHEAFHKMIESLEKLYLS